MEWKFISTKHLLSSGMDIDYSTKYSILSSSCSMGFHFVCGRKILDIIAFKYIIVCIAFGLVFALVTLIRSNWCSTLWKLRTQVSTKTSFVRGLSAFLVICYNQCTKTSFLILKVVSPVGVNRTEAGIYSYYGGLPYFKGKHLIRICSSCFVKLLIGYNLTSIDPSPLSSHPPNPFSVQTQ